ncbi:MAG: hypothetical protein DRP56_01120 [Planctomycetota bacterium]|nr:MAG: hypothetical protein DRP56_01120 [Planctomycetota bacterium]
MKIRIITTIYLGILAGLCGGAAAQDDAVGSDILQKTEMADKSLRREPAQMGQEYRGLRRQLMWDQVESVAAPQDQSQTDVLGDLVHQLRSLEIPQKSTPQEPNEPVPSQTDAAVGPLLPGKSQISKESGKPTPEDELVVVLEKMDRAISSLQLADVLYRQGYYELAFENYCTVDEQLSEGRVTDHQWILFQKANCRRHSNPNEAIGFYNELIKSFPNSKWTTAANSRLKMTEWSQLNQIRDLAENETDDTNNG